MLKTNPNHLQVKFYKKAFAYGHAIHFQSFPDHTQSQFSMQCSCLQQQAEVCGDYNKRLLHRSYDTTQDYFINVSTPCSPRSAPAGVRLEVAVFASLCQYFSESEKQWRTDGMVPLAETNASRIVCRTRHLTAFGGGVFVPINAISFKVPVSTAHTHTKT